MVHQSVWSFFLTVHFAWSTAHIGVVMAVAALAGAVVQSRAVGAIVRVLGDRRAAILGSLIGVASSAGIVFASTPVMLYTCQAVGVAGSFGAPAARSWISRSIGAAEQGTVQGALTGVDAIAEACVPVTVGVIFGSLIGYGHPPLIFAGAAAFAAASTFLLATTREPAATGEPAVIG
jgi:DHA1 family tetracycline resistance protein-like MFS transporter